MLVPAVWETLEAVVPGLRAAHFWGAIGASDRVALKNRRRRMPIEVIGMKATKCWWTGWHGTGSRASR